MARVIKLEGRRKETRAWLRKSSPIDLAVVLEPLERRGEVIHLVMAEEWIFLDAQFIPLALHYVDGIVQHTLHQEVTQLSHQHMRLGKITHRDRKRSDVIVMAVRDRNRV